MITAATEESATVHISSIQADFVQEKHMKMLVQPIRSTGIFSFQAPSSLRWEYHSPVRSILLMHGDTIKKYMDTDGTLQEEPAGAMGSMQVIMAEIAGWLDGRFTDNAMFTVSFPDKTHVMLTPRPGMLDGLIGKIELHLSNRDGLLESVTIHEGPGCYTQMTFTNRVLNKPIAAELFTGK